MKITRKQLKNIINLVLNEGVTVATGDQMAQAWEKA